MRSDRLSRPKPPIIGGHDPRRVADHRRAGRHVPRHDGAGTDDRVVAHRHARQDQGGPADPDVGADRDRATELEAGPARLGIARVVRGEDLDARPDLRARTDRHRDHVEDHAAEVEERLRAERDVVAVVAMEWRPDHRLRADAAEMGGQQRVPLRRRQRQRGVVVREPRHVGGGIPSKLGIARAVERAREHLLFLGSRHRASSSPWAWRAVVEAAPVPAGA